MGQIMIPEKNAGRHDAHKNTEYKRNGLELFPFGSVVTRKKMVSVIHLLEIS
jgi:hypothetical protein